MPLIKRYPNRKLYDTEDNQYVNLAMIAQMIRNGDEVQVVDHVSGEDLTAVTFAQIIMEREKKEQGFVPRTILAELIRAGEETWNSLRPKLASTAEIIQNVDQEIAIRLDALIQRGEIAEEEGRKLHDQLILSRRDWLNPTRITDKDIEDALARHDLPTKNDLQKIFDQVQALSNKLDRK